VIKGNMDVLLYYGANICKWDSCAGEAIILALGGYFTDKYNNPISYNPKEAAKSNYGNNEGSFCGFGKEFYS
jgi:3'-phosphoadenosine 5'-phosphosulfate (PAPS) 3'-phosphatase